ncbi:MAG: MBOAT family protein [Bacteroidales bacterium]|nr:MBOAT family protein [Bacteroidales bacterium]MDD4058759.1 MBOAT family protein [Bacteroidales bacterium]
MLFNSVAFAIFLPIVFLLYWTLAKRGHKIQNILLLAASLYFYASWDWRFLLLLLISILLGYISGVAISNTQKEGRRKLWLWVSVVMNLGFLGFFKYYNFFADSFSEALSMLGINAGVSTLNIILPVGISFYTFHGLSYVIDIYNRKIQPEKDFVNYSLFVSYFPLLVAGPIERATHLLPQIAKSRTFEYSNAVNGLRQILWGLFKKIVIADNCAEYANIIFNNHQDHSGSTLLIGALLFTFQIYGDFSGYSDIALGVSRLFGIELLRNFAYPYFSRDIAEFWRRWHISLSSWFRDYVYIPLGGSRGGLWMKIRNTFAIFLLSGFWHGANWTYVAWGALNALYFLPLMISGKNRSNLEIVAKGRRFPSLKEFGMIILTLFLTVLAWIFFRAESIGDAVNIVAEIFSVSLFTIPSFVGVDKTLPLILLLIVFIIVEWRGRERDFAIRDMGINRRRAWRWSWYVAIMLSIYLFGNFASNIEFIYFQF